MFSPLLGVLEITPVGALCMFFAFTTAALLVKVLWRDDRKLKQFQRECQDLSNVFSKVGFHLLPPILNDVALLDFVQLSFDFKRAAQVLSDPKLRSVELAQLLKGLVDDQFSDKRTAQVFLDDVVALGHQLGFTPSASALGGQEDDSLLDDVPAAPPVSVVVHNHPTGTEAAAGAKATSTTLVG